MARPRDEPQILERESEFVVYKFKYGGIVIRDNALDGGNDEFPLKQSRIQILHCLLEVRWRYAENDNVAGCHYLIDVLGYEQKRALKLHIAYIFGIVSVSKHSFYHFGIADMPVHMPSVLSELSYDGGGPTAVSYDGKSWVIT